MRKELAIVILTSILSAIGMGIFGPVYLLYFERVSGNYLEVTTAFGIFWMVVALLEIPFGHLSDKFGRKPFIVLGGFISSLVSFSYLFVTSASQLYFLELISGTATSMQTPALNSLLSEIASKKNRGKTFGLFNSSINFTYGLASLFSGILIGIFGISSIFIISSLFQISSTAIASKIKH